MAQIDLLFRYGLVNLSICMYSICGTVHIVLLSGTQYFVTMVVK